MFAGVFATALFFAKAFWAGKGSLGQASAANGVVPLISGQRINLLKRPNAVREQVAIPLRWLALSPDYQEERPPEFALHEDEPECNKMTEHREAQRRRVFKAGKILLDGGGAIDCTVRNLSQTGAALEVVTPIGVPERFDLMIEAGQVIKCEVVRRTERRIGIRFVNPFGIQDRANTTT